MIRRPPRSTLDRSSAASDVYKRQVDDRKLPLRVWMMLRETPEKLEVDMPKYRVVNYLSLIHISEPTRPY